MGTACGQLVSFDRLAHTPKAKGQQGGNLKKKEKKHLLFRRTVEEALSPYHWALGPQHVVEGKMVFLTRFLPQTDDIRNLVLLADEIGVADLRCYYYQRELAEEVRNFNGVQIGSEYFRIKRRSMGASISVYVAHTLSANMHKNLLAVATKHLTYIDNWYSAGNNVEADGMCPG
jgi:hypothetical protein